MHLFFREIEAVNFLSFEKLCVKPQTGITIIDGWNDDAQTSNGSGKTSIFESIAWCLYGVCSKRLQQSEIIRNGETSTSVVVKLEDKQGRLITIKRTLNPNSLVVTDHMGDWETDSQRTTQARLNKYLGYNYDTFSRTVYFPQTDTDRFLTLAPEERKDLLFRLQNLDQFDDLKDIVANDLNECDKQIELMTTRMTSLLTQAKDYHDQLKLYKEKSNNFVHERNKELGELDNEIDSIEHQLNAKMAERRALEVLKDDAAPHIVERNELLKKLEDIQDLYPARASLKEKQKALIDDIQRYEGQLSSINADGSPCPYCTKPLDEVFAEAKAKEVNLVVVGKKKSLKALKVNLVKIEKVIVEMKPQLTKQADTLKETIQDIQNRDNNLDEVIKFMGMMQERRIEKQKYRGRLMAKANEYAELVKDIKERLRNGVAECEKLDKNINDTIEERQVLFDLKTVFGPHGLKSVILEGLITELNQTVREYMSILYDHAIDIIFRIVEKQSAKTIRQKLEVVCMVNGQEWTLNALSGGEKRKAVLAADMALSQIIAKRSGHSFNIMMLDEVTSDLDSYSRARFYELLQGFSADKAIYLVEHAFDRHSIKDVDVLMVQKSQGISRIKEA